MKTQQKNEKRILLSNRYICSKVHQYYQFSSSSSYVTYIHNYVTFNTGMMTEIHFIVFIVIATQGLFRYSDKIAQGRRNHRGKGAQAPQHFNWGALLL